MPKFGSHFIFAELARTKRPDLFEQGNDQAFRLGSVGPDTTLFMFDPATNDPSVRDGIATALEVLETIQDVTEEIEKITAIVSDPATDLADWLTGGVYSDVKYLVNASIEALFLAVKAGIGVGVGNFTVQNPIFGSLPNLPSDFLDDPTKNSPTWTISSADTVGFPFRLFGHPYTDDRPWKEPLPIGDYREWWWMDILHYRKTGQFATQLLRNANSPNERAYAQGYMTHVAGDVCGHPFINGLVRGPFRNHAYRHLVLETLADTWLWEHEGRGDVLGARFDELIDLDGGNEEAIARLVVGTMRDVYSAPMVPGLLANGYPTEDEWLSAYKLMQQYLRLSTGKSIQRPKPPPDSLEDVFNEMKELLKNNVPGPFPKPGSSIKSFLKALFSWLAKGLNLLIMIATLPIALVTFFAGAGIRWLIYLLNQAVYMIVSSLRTLLCLSGWGYCSSDDFANYGFLEGMISLPRRQGEYPFKTVRSPKQPFYWLIDPLDPSLGPQSEDPSTWPVTPSNRGIMPDIMIDPNNQMDVQRVLDFVHAQTPEETRNLEWAAEDRPVFGNAVDFSIALLDGTIPVADFDLDGDRGFGYKGWEDLPPGQQPPKERYV